MTEAEVRQIELTVEQYCASYLIDGDGAFRDPDVRARLRYVTEALAYNLTAVLQVPAMVLQRDRVIATYPRTWWDAIKECLGWKHEREEVRLNEHLIFPDVTVPKRGDLARRLVYVQPRHTRQLYADAETPIKS